MKWVCGILVVLACAGAEAKPTSFTVRGVHVEKDGLWGGQSGGAETPEKCAHFRLSGEALLHWFRQANEVGVQAWRQDVGQTSCFAKGTLTTTKGETYNWVLDRSGQARVHTSATTSVYLSGPELPFASN
ncbi:MAG: hypothetical protein PW843_13320 [Azospirillaceae bacterium]|nr:hypothetical protein [Azospirillaceae bacterium]